MKEVWGGSDPATIESEAGNTETDQSTPTRSPVIVDAWWGFWIIMIITGQVAGRLTSRAEALQQLLTASAIGFVANVVAVPAAVAAILVVLAVDARQTKRYECLTKLRVK